MYGIDLDRVGAALARRIELAFCGALDLSISKPYSPLIEEASRMLRGEPHRYWLAS
jgi:hypothetical protein